jgi:large subunit ribosomal protein L11
VPQLEKVGKISRRQLREIAEVKMPDMNTGDVDMVMRQIEGTAKQMGITISD